MGPVATGMPMKRSGPADLEVVDGFDGGVGWIAYPDEPMQRASHALEGDGGLWVIDPVDAAGVDDLLAERGEVAGVAVLLDRHRRDAASLAARHDVAVHVPSWMSGVADSMDVPVQRFEDRLGGYEAERLIDNAFWQEAILYDGETLVVPEALGTVGYYTVRDRRLGVHPMLRPLPPRSLLAFSPERLLVGHGEGCFEDVPARIRGAIERSRRTAPSLYLKTLRNAIGLG